MNLSTLTSLRPDFSRMNFALDSVIRFVRIRRESIYGFSKVETVTSRLKMVGLVPNIYLESIEGVQ